VFGLRAALGRTFAPEDDDPDRPRVVVLSHRLWASQFGSDLAISHDFHHVTAVTARVWAFPLH